MEPLPTSEELEHLEDLPIEERVDALEEIEQRLRASLEEAGRA